MSTNGEQPKFVFSIVVGLDENNQAGVIQNGDMGLVTILGLLEIAKMTMIEVEKQKQSQIIAARAIPKMEMVK